jgi:hypothetical protein
MEELHTTTNPSQLCPTPLSCWPYVPLLRKGMCLPTAAKGVPHAEATATPCMGSMPTAPGGWNSSAAGL